MAEQRWRFDMLGTFEVSCDAVPLMGVHRHKHCLLLAYLAHERRMHSRAKLVEQFWPQTEGNSNNLSQAIRRLTQLLALPGLPPDALLQSPRDGTLGLLAAAFTRDIDDFDLLLKSAARASQDAEKIAALGAAVALYRGEFLLGYPTGDEYGWLLRPRDNFRRKFVDALKTLAELFRSRSLADLSALCEEHAISAAPFSGEERALLESWRETDSAAPVTFSPTAPVPPRPAPDKDADSNARAVAAYNQGRRLWKIRAHAPLKESLDWFARAIAADPMYAPAYAGMADAYSLLGYYCYMEPRQAAEHARQWATQALDRMEGASASEKATALTADAWIKMIFDCKWNEAEVAFLQALNLDPNNETAHQWYSYYLMLQGSTQQSLKEIRTACQLEPRSGILSKSVGERYHYKHLYKDAIEKYQDALRDAPHYCLTHYCLGKAYEQQALRCRAAGLIEEAQDLLAQALDAFKRALALGDAQEGPQNPALTAGLAHAYAQSGDPARARECLSQLQMQRDSEGCYVSPVALATIHLGLEEPDTALDCLETALDERPGDLVLVPIDPRFAGLRDDARFASVVRAIGLWHVSFFLSEPCL